MNKAIVIVVLGLLLSSNAYAGCIKGNCTNGQGTFTDAAGNKYVGEWKDSKYHGQGTFIWYKFIHHPEVDGRHYVGEFKDGKYHGQGTFTFLNGDKYVREFKDGQPQRQDK